ncbi:MAG UNVERIFIED_CONTAM: pyrroline-5-carboxylate reductase [Planctomycetaceae bacterium]|jgi:pyrroline-5-carboxylate reductase
MDFSQHRIAFIGSGQMASALAAGFVRSLLSPAQITACDPSPEARERFRQAIGAGAHLSTSMSDAVRNATVVILAVKPQIMPEALQELAPLLSKTPLVISVAAGITLARIAESLPAGTRLIRVMPNTPCLIGRGASGAAAAATATPEDLSLAEALLTTVGSISWVSETLLDAVTGLSGSGPAYVFQIIEALSDGGVKMGLPRAVALKLAAQTVAGGSRHGARR